MQLLIIYTFLIFTVPSVDLGGIKVEDDDGELELQLALKKAERLRSRGAANKGRLPETVMKVEMDEEDKNAGNITLNATAEFCRTLGDIPTYGLSGNREENDQEFMVPKLIIITQSQ